MACSVAVLTPTIGRETLQGAVTSFMLEAGPGDQMFVMGDGIQPDIVPNEKVVVTHEEKLGNFGHQHIHNRLEMDGGLKQTHFILLNDDDEWFPGALTLVKKYLIMDMNLAMPICWDESPNDLASHYFARYVGREMNRQETGGLRAFMPTRTPIEWRDKREDRFLQQEMFERYSTIYLPLPVHRCRVNRESGGREGVEQHGRIR